MENQMKIEILGDGCSKCNVLKNNVLQAVNEVEVNAEVTSVMDPMRIADLEVLSLPQLVIDGQVVPSANKISVDEIKELLRCAKK
jgi:small redox-active disulfide protein 2